MRMGQKLSMNQACSATLVARENKQNDTLPKAAVSIQIQLNGEPVPLPLPLTVHALLGVFSLDPRLVAVELNKVVVRRDAYESTVIDDGDEVEIVAFVGGG